MTNITKTFYDPKQDKWFNVPYEEPDKPYLVLRRFVSYCEPTQGYEEMYVTKEYLDDAELMELNKNRFVTDLRYVPDDIDPDLPIITIKMQEDRLKQVMKDGYNFPEEHFD